MYSHGNWGRPGPAFAFGGFGPSDEGAWQPWAREERGPRGFGGPWGFGGPRMAPPGPAFWHMARHFPFGPGMQRGGPRMFGRGDLKYALLDLLGERPKHGYEMIKELEERTSGFYTPSAGAVYPTLQLLEDRGWVTSQTQDGKKVYAITDSGREAVKEHQQQREEWRGPGGPREWGEHGHGHEHGHEHGHGHGGPFGPGAPFGRHARPELRELRREGIEVAQLVRVAVMTSAGDPERLGQLRAIIQRTRSDLQAFIGQGASQGAGQGAHAPTGGAEAPTPPPPADTPPPVEEI